MRRNSSCFNDNVTPKKKAPKVLKRQPTAVSLAQLSEDELIKVNERLLNALRKTSNLGPGALQRLQRENELCKSKVFAR